MTTRPQHGNDAGRLMVQPFPSVGPLIRLAYRDLHTAATSTDKDQLAKLADIATLPRPWDPGTCQRAELRAEIWSWLDQVVIWLNTDYAWDVAQLVPTCWPQHPHLVHELATVADQRRRAGASLNSEALEEWHRYTLPTFAQRMNSRLREHCENEHQPCPSRGRHIRHISGEDRHSRHLTMAQDKRAAAVAEDHPSEQTPTQGSPRRLRVIIDTATGEIHGDDREPR